MKKLNYEKVFNDLTNWTENYLKDNNIKSVVLGISGGIDSTVASTIIREACNRVGIPFIGRSLTIKNKKEETTVARLVGESFCTDFKEIYMGNFYKDYLINLYLEEYSRNDNSLGSRNVFMLSTKELEELDPFKNKISNGNIMARLRMSYLYDLAGRNNGLVIDTDNLTEHYLGFWTIHGDEGDLGPIGNLWKSEVYGLASYISNYYRTISTGDDNYFKQATAIQHSISLTPTDGNGISNSDLEQIGGRDYFEVDDILIPIVMEADPDSEELSIKYIEEELINKKSLSRDTVYKIYNRYKKSSFKRLTSRTIKVPFDRLSCSID